MDELGSGRYRLGEAVDRRRQGGLFRAVDARLGRTVLVQCDQGIAFPERAADALNTGHPWLAPLLDGGDDRGPDGSPLAWAVYPDSAWLPVTRLSRPQRRRLRATVALDTDDLLVDPRWLAGRPSFGDGPVLWLPSPAALGDSESPTTHWTTVGTFPTSFREEVA